jgi:anthranilate phosphoribosyltransferase
LAVDAILQGKCSEVSIAGFLTALAAKGETAAEIAGMADALRSHAVAVKPASKPLIDIVGTGGDGSSTLNISTTAALVAAGAGLSVAKHGNRAITSKCGSADLLAGLGVKIDAAPEVIAKCIDEAHIGFMYAPSHHPTMKYVQPIRKALGFRTVFNILGPLANPAKVSLQVVGVAKRHLLEIMAQALEQLGVSRAMVVYGSGTDEFTVCGPTDIAELRDGKINVYTFDHKEYGIKRADIKELAGGGLEDNVAITRGVLAGEIGGAKRDVVVLNAAASLVVAGRAKDFAEGIAVADESIASGKAIEALEKLVAISNS